MKKLKLALAAALLAISAAASIAEAKIEVLFHPVDPTLPKIAEWIKQAEKTIDIAMYNMETSSNSPVVAAIMDPAVQTRIRSGALSVRVIFEGYGTPAENEAKMAELEAMGLDARSLASGKHVHHKFAIIDSDRMNARIVTGSANWSMSSYRNYDENMLFIESELETVAQFGKEFELLWSKSNEFGNTSNHPVRTFQHSGPFKLDDMDAFFNAPRLIAKNPAPEHVLQNQIVRLIESAQTEIVIATTRIRLLSVLSAVKAAADRGVKIKILISQDDFKDLHKRAQYVLGHNNIELRIKFYSLRPSDYITFQMHNKWMVVDKKTILTGSFNWSDSSESAHIENIVTLGGARAAEVFPNFLTKFDELWERGRAGLPAFEADLQSKKEQRVTPPCKFPATSLRYEEVKKLLRLAPRCN